MAEFPANDGTELVLALIASGELAQAGVILDSLIRRDPGHAILHFLRGSVALKDGRFDEAVEALALADSLDPTTAMFRDVLEEARLTYAKRLVRDDAAAARAQIDAANAERPDGIFAVLRAATWLEAIPTSRAAMQTGRNAYEAAVQGLADLVAPIDPSRILRAGPHFYAAYQGVDARPCQQAVADFYRRNCPALSYRAPHVDAAPGAIRTIGFVSAYLSNHSIGKLYRGIIQRLDRRRFRVVTLSFGRHDDVYGRAIAAESDAHVILPRGLAEAQAAIAAERLDILFYPEIGMDPLTYFLAFARLARVQVMGWGHPMTSGISSIDAFISSTDLEEAGQGAEAHYVERLIRLSLPPTYLYAPEASAPGDAPDLSFAHGRTIYCCPQLLFKIHPDFDAILFAILERDPNGVLVFIEAEPGGAKRLCARWQLDQRGLAERVVFLPRLTHAAYLALLAAVPVVLDTIHFSGGISTVETLAQGTPVVTWPTTFMCGRVSYAYYRAMGLDDCIAQDAEDYVARAVRLGTDEAWRAEVRARIRNAVPRLFKRADMLREFEDALIAAGGDRDPREPE